MADNKATLKAGDVEVELPILSGTAGHDVIDCLLYTSDAADE